jgi:hypothetical protein
MDPITELKKNLQRQGKKQVPLQSVYAIVKEVDWDKKTMTAVGVKDDLEYFKVKLGIGSYYRKPKQNTLCIIGTIENNEVDKYLIDAAEVEQHLIIDQSGFEWLLNNGNLTMNGDNFGAMIKIQELEDNLNQLKTYVENMKTSIGTGFTAVKAGTAADGPGGKTAFDGAMASQSINFKNMANDKIKHGG